MSAVAAEGVPDRAAGLGVLAAASISALVVNANTSAVTILLPTMSKDVGAPVAQLQWAVTGYMLIGAAVIVTSGALGDVLGRRHCPRASRSRATRTARGRSTSPARC
jgi:MFS family permease